MSTPVVSLLMTLFSVLAPQKMWFAPDQPISVNIKSDKDVTLVATNFDGKVLSPKGSPDAAANQTVDLKTIFPDLTKKGTYIVYAVSKGTAAPAAGVPKEFLGTPLLVQVMPYGQGDKPDDTMVTHVEPLRYAVMTTDDGKMTMAFYYVDAPRTIESFLQLSSEGYYDGLTFHRIIKNFVVQGGDPTGTGEGGPGYELKAEFNDKPHLPGVLSMARTGDPNSAGSQFFICLDYASTKQLDNKYTAFGQVTDGMDVVKKLGETPVNDEKKGDPKNPVHIQKVEVLPVTSENDPYRALIDQAK